MEMTVGLFAMELAKAAHPEQSTDSDLKRDIRAAMRQKAEGEYRAALAGAIQSGLIVARSPIGRVPASLVQTADFSDPLWLLDDAAQGKARELFGIAPAELPVLADAGARRAWTDARKAEARAMRERLQATGAQDYAAQTAAHFGVSTSRLRKLLNDDAGGPASGNAKGPAWAPLPGRIKRK